jgi:hemerythrin
MFEWDSRYSVGNHSIDAQHQALFAIAQELFTAMSAGQGKSALSRTLDRLANYTTSHFAHEERLMQRHQYPDLAAHKAEHEALRARVLQFQSDFRAGRAPLVHCCNV